MRYGSLFSGIGGMDLGLDRAGMECAWQVEIDPYCRKVLTKHWPDVPKFGDIRDCGKHNLEPVDLICGGFPCQDISYAGKGTGIEGERSGLWSEYHRIICELRPRIVLVENVPALLARGLGRVLGDLAESGYDAEWDCIPAAAVGAPHRRDRVFVVAYSGGIGFSRGDCCKDLLAKGSRGEQAVWGEDRVVFKVAPGGRERIRAQWWSHQSRMARCSDGVPGRLDRLKCHGNAVVPQVAEHIGRMIMAATQ